jgi:hypothetical protein
MRDFCFCTLALGLRYSALAKQLAGDLARYAPGAPFIVFSDCPSVFRDAPNVQVFPHRRRSVLGYNDKLCVIHRALQLHRTCIFLDADGRIFDKVELEDEIFEPGLRAYRLRSWTYNWHEALENIQNSWASGGIRIMHLLRRELRLKQSEDDLIFVVEFLYSITRNEKIDAFLQKWEELANFCESRRYFSCEGYAMGLAAMLTGFPLSQHNFKGLNFFETLIPLKEHAAQGRSLSEQEYNDLKASIQRFKTIPLPMDISSRIRRRIKKNFQLSYRYTKVKTLGLNLLA